MAKNRKPIVYPKENEKKDKQTIQTLKSRIRRLEKDKKRLVSEVKTLEKAFYESNKKIQELLKEKKLEEILEIEEHTNEHQGSEFEKYLDSDNVRKEVEEKLSEKEKTRRKFSRLNRSNNEQ